MHGNNYEYENETVYLPVICKFPLVTFDGIISHSLFYFFAVTGNISTNPISIPIVLYCRENFDIVIITVVCFKIYGNFSLCWKDKLKQKVIIQWSFVSPFKTLKIYNKCLCNIYLIFVSRVCDHHVISPFITVI